MKPDGTEFNPITNPDSMYPVYGSYGAGMSGFRPGYSMSSGSSTISGSSSKFAKLISLVSAILN